ncbi:methanogenic corrinoid protein MtbC1 [Nakamurella sp. UYEF19]|uniref:B12-binding domain-containing protein n=1 Tax=Nakamurella sp. UYEF19 TaxID=1756392 RepID=UPI003396659B
MSEDGPAATCRREVLDASIRLDSVGITRVLSEAAATIGVAVCIDEVVLPTMRQIGVWWAAGNYSIAQELMTTETVRAWLDELSTRAPVPTHRRPVFLACGPRDRHTLAGEALALLLRLQGWHCRVLGARISASSLMFAVAATPPAAVVVTSHLAAHRSHALPAITAVHDSGTTVFYAGNAFATFESREGVKGTYLGNHIGDACTLIRGVIEPRRAPGATAASR